jgi:hypothetical protein
MGLSYGILVGAFSILVYEISIIHFFPSHYHPNDFCFINRPPRGMRRLPFPDRRQFDPDIAQDS